MDFITETLNWVNAVRAEHNIGEPLDRLPNGITGESCHCPIARALHAEVGTRDALIEATVEYGDGYDIVRGDHVTLPECARQFINAFDNGELPEFDEHA